MNFLQWTAAVFHSITQHNLPRQARGSAPPGPPNLSPIYLPPPLGTKLINTPTPLSTPFLPCRRQSLYERPRDDVKSPRPSDHLVGAGPNGSLRSAQCRHVWARMRGPTGTPGPVCGRDCLCKGLDSDRNFVSLPAAVNYWSTANWRRPNRYGSFPGTYLDPGVNRRLCKAPQVSSGTVKVGVGGERRVLLLGTVIGEGMVKRESNDEESGWDQEDLSVDRWSIGSGTLEDTMDILEYIWATGYKCLMSFTNNWWMHVQDLVK